MNNDISKQIHKRRLYIQMEHKPENKQTGKFRYPFGFQFNRRSIRLKGYDYSQNGAYFITICSHNRAPVFGRINDGKIILNEIGNIIYTSWQQIPQHFPNVELDEFIIMPNHVHGIVVIDDACRGTACRAPAKHEQFKKPVAGSIPTIIRSFKSAVTKQINLDGNTHGVRIWQRNYYEHIIRNENELNRIREYIINNPVKWNDGENSPTNIRIGE